MRETKTGAPGDERRAEAARRGDRDGFFEEEDAEAAAICLMCPRAECRMDRNLPCLRYRRAIRALKQARAESRSGKGGAREEGPDPLQIAMGAG